MIFHCICVLSFLYLLRLFYILLFCKICLSLSLHGSVILVQLRDYNTNNTIITHLLLQSNNTLIFQVSTSSNHAVHFMFQRQARMAHIWPLCIWGTPYGNERNHRPFIEVHRPDNSSNTMNNFRFLSRLVIIPPFFIAPSLLLFSY